MSDTGKCSFYRDFISDTAGQCDCSGSRMICAGNILLCEHSEDLRERLREGRGTYQSHEEENPKRPARYRVLVVDDQELMGKLIADLLSRFGHQCKIARSGAEAIDKMIEEEFDAVITDIVMPEMDGVALTKALLALYPKLPIMIMTGHSRSYSSESALLTGAREFIKKSFSIDEFILHFNKMMRESRDPETGPG